MAEIGCQRQIAWGIQQMALAFVKQFATEVVMGAFRVLWVGVMNLVLGCASILHFENELRQICWFKLTCIR